MNSVRGTLSPKQNMNSVRGSSGRALAYHALGSIPNLKKKISFQQSSIKRQLKLSLW
jgi:hypothetical protein